MGSFREFLVEKNEDIEEKSREDYLPQKNVAGFRFGSDQWLTQTPRKMYELMITETSGGDVGDPIEIEVAIYGGQYADPAGYDSPETYQSIRESEREEAISLVLTFVDRMAKKYNKQITVVDVRGKEPDGTPVRSWFDLSQDGWNKGPSGHWTRDVQTESLSLDTVISGLNNPNTVKSWTTKDLLDLVSKFQAQQTGYSPEEIANGVEEDEWPGTNNMSRKDLLAFLKKVAEYWD